MNFKCEEAFTFFFLKRKILIPGEIEKYLPRPHFCYHLFPTVDTCFFITIYFTYIKQEKLSKTVPTDLMTSNGIEERELQNTLRALIRRQVVCDEKVGATKRGPVEDCSGTGTKLFVTALLG